MAAIAWTDVIAMAPDVTTVPTVAQNDILAYINTTAMNADEWGGEDSDRLKLGRILLAAHYGFLMLQGGRPSGPMTMDKVGEVTTQFASQIPPGLDPLIDRTTYGQSWHQMVRTSRSRAPFVV